MPQPQACVSEIDYARIKILTDRLVASLLFVVSLPLILAVMVLVKMASNGWMIRINRYRYRDTKTIDRDGSRSPNMPSVVPRLWDLFPFILPRKVREEAYMPSQQELIEDFLLTRKAHPSDLARRWVTLAFTARTACIVLQCLGVMLGEKAKGVFLWTVEMLLGEEAIEVFREIMFRIFGRS